MGIASHLIYRRRKEIEKYGKGSFSGNRIIKMTPEEKELADLKERMRKLELENEILKKQCSSFQETIGKFGQIPIHKRE